MLPSMGVVTYSVALCVKEGSLGPSTAHVLLGTLPIYWGVETAFVSQLHPVQQALAANFSPHVLTLSLETKVMHIPTVVEQHSSFQPCLC